MIVEIAEIRVHAGSGPEFERAIRRGIAEVLSTATGFRGAEVHRGIENPLRYVLRVQWDTLEDHTEGFRGGPLFVRWREIVGPFFAAPPEVEHAVHVLDL